VTPSQADDVPDGVEELGLAVRVLEVPTTASQEASAQPDPWSVAAASCICWRNTPTPPKVSSRRSARSPFGSPPFGLMVGPEQRVQDVARYVEREVLLEHRHEAQVALAAHLTRLLERLVGALDVAGVMLVVMQLHRAPPRSQGRSGSV